MLKNIMGLLRPCLAPVTRAPEQLSPITLADNECLDLIAAGKTWTIFVENNQLRLVEIVVQRKERKVPC